MCSVLAGHMDLALEATVGSLALLWRGAGRDARQDLADNHSVPGSGLRVQIIIKVKHSGEGAVLCLQGSRPDNMEIVLMRMHPHKAGEEFQARRRLFLGFLKSSSV
jgi:hypothetical protein